MIVAGTDLVSLVERHVDDYDPHNIGVVSLDIRLGPKILAGSPGVSRIELENGKPYYYGFTENTYAMGDVITLLPGHFYIAHSIEFFRMPSHVAGHVYMRSTLGRRAVEHLHAGLAEPGWSGHMTFEVTALVETQVVIGERIAQVEFVLTSQPVNYDGNYNGQVGPTIAAGGIIASQVKGGAADA